jgi:hypothetical protein
MTDKLKYRSTFTYVYVEARCLYRKCRRRRFYAYMNFTERTEIISSNSSALPKEGGSMSQTSMQETKIHVHEAGIGG